MINFYKKWRIKRQNFFLIIGFLPFLLVTCDNSYDSSIPDFPVHLELNLLVSPNTKLKNSVNQFLIIDEKSNLKATDRIGFSGILVYTDFDGKYRAFDLCCPYEAQRDIKIMPNEKGEAVCEKCGSVFFIGYGIGNLISGPAKQPLKRYKAIVQGDVLYIYN